MGQTADQLRQEIEQKRDDAAQKIDAIEARVQDTVQQARDTVQDTVQHARDTVMETVDETVQKAKDTFDFRRQVEEKPLLTLGAALVGGFVLGGLLGGDDDRRGSRYEARPSGAGDQGYGTAGQTGGVRAGIRGAARESGLEDTLNNLASAFMGSLTERLRSAASESFPALADKLQAMGPGGESNGQRHGSTTGSGSRAAGIGASAAESDSMGRPTPYFASEGASGTAPQR